MRPPAAAAAALAALALAGPGRAQDGGPVVITREQQFQFLGLSSVRLAVELLAAYRQDDRTDVNGNKTHDYEDQFRTVFEVDAEGFIGHPNLVDLSLLGRFQLEQRDFHQQSQTIRTRNPENINEYDVSGTILRESSAPVTLYTRQTFTNIERQFADSLDATTSQYGVQWQIKSDKIPSYFEYFHRDENQENISGTSDFRQVQDSVLAHSELRTGNTQRLSIDYAFDSVDQSGNVQLPDVFDQNDATVIHSLFFGPDRRSELRSKVNYFDRTGRRPVDRFRWDERIDYRPTRTLEIRGEFALDRNQQAVTDQRSLRFTGGVRHHLFDSLVSEIGGSYVHLTQPDIDFTSDLTTFFTTADYTKKVPAGLLTATAGLTLTRQENSGGFGSVAVTDEAHTFPPSDLIIIFGQNIEPSSVVITDLSGFIVYQNGLDYTLTPFPDRLEIRRVLGGNIAPGETVLIDYRLLAIPDTTIDTDGFAIAARYDIREGPLAGLSLYTQYVKQNQHVSTNFPGLVQGEDVRINIYGAEYAIWHLNFLGEYRDRASSLSPYTQTRLEGNWVEPLGRRSAVTLTARWDEINRQFEGLRSESFTISGRWTQQLTNTLSADLYLLWRDEDDTQGTRRRGFEQELDLRWNYRQTSAYATIRTRNLDTEVDDTFFLSLLVGLRREF